MASRYGVHRSVLREPACAALLSAAAGVDGVYLDATFGRGGHAAAVLAQLSTHGRLIALDRDPQAIAAGRELFADETRLTLVHASFSRMTEVSREYGHPHVDGVLMDLGVSSPQLDQAARGFSFMHDGPLDMRMDTSRGLTAAQWLAGTSEGELARVLRDYGEEPQARRLARTLMAAQRTTPIETTSQLAALVSAAVGRRDANKRHPATRTFQALRIEVNGELNELKSALDQLDGLLADGGTLSAISFHSLEDRLVKQFIRDASRVDPRLARLPIVPEHAQPTFEPVGRAVRADEGEVEANPRARSATLRAARRRPRRSGEDGA
ncbi:MAG: 16S rRNA (cytosine(1402)-N(4))-methyltransferase RsmH [Pseudomonadota bacterium]